MPFEFWDQVLHLRVLIPLTLVLAGFLPLLISIYNTYMADKDTIDSE